MTEDECRAVGRRAEPDEAKGASKTMSDQGSDRGSPLTSPDREISRCGPGDFVASAQGITSVQQVRPCCFRLGPFFLWQMEDGVR